MMIWRSEKLIVMIVLAVTVLSVGGQVLLGTAYTDKSEISIYGYSYEYAQAKQACINMESRLVKVDSKEVTDAIISKSQNKWVWIGASDLETERDWRWIDGSRIRGYTNWMRGEPSNGAFFYSGEDCAVAMGNGQWNDFLCDSKQRFAYEKDLPVEVRHEAHIFEFHRLSEEKNTFVKAQERCKSAHSRLVEIHDKNMNAVIQSKLEKENTYYWSGGSDIEEEGEWKWNNRTVVGNFGWYRRTETNGEPNGKQVQNCLAIAYFGWLDYGCSQKFAYICEKVAASTITVSSTTVQVGYDVAKINCTAKGYPTPSYSWVYKGFDISTGLASVYQTTTETGATLHIDGATLLDEGVYTCWANNTVGNTSYAVQKSSTIKVPSRPTNLSVSHHSCNSSITVSWIPNKRAVLLPHRIFIRSVSDNESTFYTPTTNDPKLVRYQTKNLSSWTYYDVLVTPCPTAEMCKTEYQVTRTVRTNGIPGAITRLVISETLHTSCKIMWNPPKFVPKNTITGFEINIVEYRENIPSGNNKSDAWIRSLSRVETSYTFDGKPNRRYSFGIRAKTCAGAGPIVWSRQSCNFTQQVPNVLHKPNPRGSINNAGEASVSIQIPDQENGPISCLFVIVNPDPGNSTNNRTTYTVIDLIKANQSHSANNTTDDYISVSLVVSRLDGLETTVVLGNGSTTECDIHTTTSMAGNQISASSNTTFVGRNLRLDPRKQYSIFIVSTTPSRVGVLLKASKMQLIQREQGSTDLWIIIAVSGGCVLFVFLIVGLILGKRRVAANRMAKEDNQTMPSNERQETQYDTNLEDEPATAQVDAARETATYKHDRRYHEIAPIYDEIKVEQNQDTENGEYIEARPAVHVSGYHNSQSQYLEPMRQ